MILKTIIRELKYKQQKYRLLYFIDTLSITNSKIITNISTIVNNRLAVDNNEYEIIPTLYCI